MPIHYKIDPIQQTVFMNGSGLITTAELLDYQQSALAEAEAAKFDRFDELLDVMQGEFKTLTSDMMSKLAERAAALGGTVRPSYTAIVVKNDLQFGFARVYQAYREFAGEGTKRVAVFRDRAEAIAWLDAHRAADQKNAETVQR